MKINEVSMTDEELSVVMASLDLVKQAYEKRAELGLNIDHEGLFEVYKLHGRLMKEFF